MNWHKLSLITTTCAALLAGVVHAQEPDPAATPALPPPSDPVIRILVQTNPSTPTAIVKLINTLVGLKEGRYAKPLVQKLIDLNLNDDQLAALHREVGSAFFLKLGSERDLQPLGEQFAGAALDRINQRVRDPQRIADSIAKLADPSALVRRNALAELQQGHDAAVQALLAVLVDDGQAEQHANIQQALTIFGSEAFEPIATLVRDGSDAVKQRAINVLARLDHPDATLYALTPAFSPKSSPSLRASARRILADDSLDTTTAAVRLYRFANDYYTGQRSLPGDEQGQTAVWRWDAATSQLNLTKIPVQLAVFEQAMRLARGGLELVPGSPELRRLYLSALVEANLATPADAGGGASQLVAQLKAEGLDSLVDLIHDALDTQRHRVAAAGLRALGTVATADILRTVDGRPGIVAQALRHPRRDVRYAALDAIAKLGPTDVFPGSTFVGETLRYMLSTSGRPRALVADPRALNAPALAGFAANLGYRPLVAHDARSTVKTAITNSDIELIIVDMLLAAPTSGHLISSLRRDARTASTPIVIVTSEPDDVPRAESIARQAGLCTTVSADADLGTIQSAASAAGTVDASAEVRLTQAKQILTWLLALDGPARDRYGWRELEPALLTALEQPTLAPQALQLLGQMPAVSAQTSLVDFASLPGRTVETRAAAATAFRESVKRFGILLTSQQMLAQYDRYNASERRPKAEQQVLAAILDTLEGVAAQESGVSK